MKTIDVLKKMDIKDLKEESSKYFKYVQLCDSVAKIKEHEENIKRLGGKQ